MVTFKEQLELDNDVFINSNEFASLHTVDGQSNIKVIIDNHYKNDIGINLADKIIQIKTSDLVNPIVKNGPDQYISIDNISYLIKDVVEDTGISYITLSSLPGDRYITVKYRSISGTGGDPDTGKPATKTDWAQASTISPNPVYEEIKNNIKVENIGIINIGDIKINIDKAGFTKTNLESYEYLVNSVEYTIIGGQVLEQSIFWVLYLRRKH